MSLKALLLGLLGSTGPEKDEPAFFEQQDSEGVLFVLPKDQFSKVATGNGNITERMQYITLTMLAEQGLADRFPNGFRLSPEQVCGLDEECVEILRLPASFTGSFRADIQGHTGHAGFRCELNVLLEGAQVNYRHEGPYIHLGPNERYRLTPAGYLALQAVADHKSLPPDAHTEEANLRLMAALQTAQRSGLDLDLSHFDRLDIHIPPSIGVTGRYQTDGSLVLYPSLLDGSEQDALERRWSQIDLTSDRTGIMRIGNRVVVLAPEKIKAIGEVLRNRHIPAHQVQDFFRTPTAFLDASLVDLELGFSVRVAGIGKFVHMEFANEAGVKPDWFLLDKLPLPVDEIPSLIHSREEAEELRDLVTKGAAQGANSVIFKGKEIVITEPERIIQTIESRIRQLERGEADQDQEQEEHPKERLSLVLKESETLSAGLQTAGAAARYPAAVDWSGVHRPPYPHQIQAVEWVMSLISAALSAPEDDPNRIQGSLLADDMGLGKTYASLVSANEYFRFQAAAGRTQKPVLVIAPLSLLENWHDEVSHTFNHSPFRDIVVLQAGADLNRFRVKGIRKESTQVAEFDDDTLLDSSAIQYALQIGPDAGVNRLDMDRRLILTTYQTLRDYQFSLCSVEWGLVIFDEAQNIKNPNALQTRAAKALRADFKLLATGTPVENSLGDFWCLLDTAQPGLLGSWPFFRERWVKPILQATDEDKPQVQIERGEDLRRTVATFMLRRTKEDQLTGLPSKIVLTGVQTGQHDNQRYEPALSVTMRGAQLKAYNEVIDGYRQSRRDTPEAANALSALQRLREISLHPRLRQDQELYANGRHEVRSVMQESGKLQALMAQLEQIRGRAEKVILFLVTKKLQRLLKFWLDQLYGLDIAIINGDTAAVPRKSDILSRKQLITRFEEKEGFNIIIMSPVAAGVGLTVVGANHVIHLERHWNPAKEAQASDRVYRIGQQRPVFIHLPILLHPEYDSFDLHLDRLLRTKIDLKDAVVTPDVVTEEQVISSLGLV